MRKFENVDLADALEKIMLTNTKHYTSDFKYDKQAIERAAKSELPEDKNLLWLSRTSGTHCHFEKDVYIKDTAAHNSWIYWGEQRTDKIIAYAVTVTGVSNGNAFGNIYELDYQKHYQDVKKNAVKADIQVLHYENGDKNIKFGLWFNTEPDRKLGKYINFDFVPNEPEKLNDVLRTSRNERQKYRLCNIEKYISELSAKPSIKKQLTENKSKVADVPGRKAKTKNNDLEV